VIYPGSTPVGTAILVVANVLTCNKHSHMCHQSPAPLCLLQHQVRECSKQMQVAMPHLVQHRAWLLAVGCCLYCCGSELLISGLRLVKLEPSGIA
jgi:hypothetical protein